MTDPDVSTQVPTHRSPSSHLKLMAIAAGVLTVAAIVAAGLTAGDNSWSSQPKPDLTKMTSACRDAVKARLKAPATAVFSDEQRTDNGDSMPWHLQGAVDAQNSFGALIRNHYNCTAAARDDGSWTVWDAEVYSG